MAANFVAKEHLVEAHQKVFNSCNCCNILLLLSRSSRTSYTANGTDVFCNFRLFALRRISMIYLALLFICTLTTSWTFQIHNPLFMAVLVDEKAVKLP